MFKKFKKNDNYFAIAVYAFLVIAASIGLIWILMNFNTITSWINGVVTAMLSFIYGFIIAYMCNPIYKKLHKYVFKFVDKKKPHPRVRKALSVTLTYIIFVSLISLLLLAIIPNLVSNIQNLIVDIDDYIADFNVWLTDFLNDLSDTIPAIDPDEILDSIYKFFSPTNGEGVFGSILSFVLDNLLNIGTTLVNQIFYIIVGFILSIYFLLYKDNIVAKLKRVFCAFLKENNYKKVVDFARYSDRTFGRYMLGAIVDSALVGIIMFVILTIFKFPFAPLIAVTCGVTNIIPFFGPFIGAIPSAVLILIATGDPFKVIIFAVIVLVLQQVDGNLIAPHIHGASTGLTPIGVIAAVTFTSHVFGFVGMVIGVPFCAVISYYISCFIEKNLKKKHLPTQPEYYRVSDVYEDENFAKARYALEAEEQLESSEAIATAAVKEEVIQEIKEQVVEKVLHEALDGINEEVEAKAKEGEV